MDTSVLPIIILLPLILGTTLVSLLQRFSRGVTALAIGVSLTSFGLLLTQARTVLGGASIQQSWDWLPQLGINLSFRLDALGLLFSSYYRYRYTHLYLCLLLFRP